MRYSVERTAAPTVDFLEDDVVYEHLRLETTGSPPSPEDSTLVEALKSAVMAHLDGVQGVLGRALITQSYKMTFRRFPAFHDPEFEEYAIRLPIRPVQSVTSVEYYDDSGALQTLASDQYRLVRNTAGESVIVPTESAIWPATQDRPDAITVSLVAGYGDAPSDVPAGIRAAGLLLVADLYEHREAQSLDYDIMPNPTVCRLLEPYRVVFYEA